MKILVGAEALNHCPYCRKALVLHYYSVNLLELFDIKFEIFFTENLKS
jgi:hypothetical protein